MATTGECFCGGVAYEVVGTLRDARSCHCSRCRKAFSAQSSAYALVDGVRWLRGESMLTTFVGQHGFGLAFCRRCGSTMCGLLNGEVHGVTLGCLNGEPEVEIGYHIFVGSKANWEVMPEGVRAYSASAMED